MSDKKKKGTYNLIGAIFLGVYAAYLSLIYISTMGPGMGIVVPIFFFPALILGALAGWYIGGYFYDNFIKKDK